MTDKIKVITGGVTAAEGFKAAGITAGLKKSGKKDLALIYCEEKSTSAACFTQNKYAAAPVIWSREHAEKGWSRAVVINSGNANACTGEEGYQNARKMAELVASKLPIFPDEVQVCSTGIIGVQLPMSIIEPGVLQAVGALSRDGGGDAAEAIRTTDTFAKEIAVEFELDGKLVKIGGISKGSGMIHPNMATMLAVITTDAVITPAALQQALKEVTDMSFNMISVDGDTSTNDSVIAFASGMAHNKAIKDDSSAGYAQFAEALQVVLVYLAKEIARDGEGASKLLEITVNGAKTVKDARLAAKSVVSSSLVKAAFFGNDANWGRIACALGYSGADFDIKLVDVSLKSAGGEFFVLKGGKDLPFDEELALKVLSEKEVITTIDFHQGQASATAWGCDLTYDYVKINGDYRS